MTPTLYHCERHADGTCPHKDQTCHLRIPHPHGNDDPVSLWCAVPSGKSVKIRCVPVGKGEK
jgi:hypothetical protein